jgi:hypothetical protein
VGLIRKSLNTTTGGAVKPESKKQRYARTAAGLPSQGQRAAEGWALLGRLLSRRHVSGAERSSV